MSFDLTNSQHKNVAQTLGLYFGGFITAAFVAGGLYTDGYKYACAFAVGGVFYFLVTLVMYAVTIPELLNIANGQTSPQPPQIEPDEEIDDDEEIRPPQPQRPLQPPVREAQFVTQAEPMTTAVNYPQWIKDFDLPPYIKRQWVAEIWQARDNGRLRKVSANKLHGVTSADRTKHINGKGEAAHLMDWLIDNRFVYEESIGNNQYEWNGKGRAFFPSPTKELTH